jgi:hypothetical protein
MIRYRIVLFSFRQVRLNVTANACSGLPYRESAVLASPDFGEKNYRVPVWIAKQHRSISPRLSRRLPPELSNRFGEPSALAINVINLKFQ